MIVALTEKSEWTCSAGMVVLSADRPNFCPYCGTPWAQQCRYPTLYTKPVRLQLSRKAGFNLQALSKATNGLPAVIVARPSGYGNPFPVKDCDGPADAVARFRSLVEGFIEESSVLRNLEALRGKNLACWCKPGEPCHADVLLELANK